MHRQPMPRHRLNIRAEIPRTYVREILHHRSRYRRQIRATGREAVSAAVGEIIR